MPETKADLLLHPVRLRIVQTLMGGRRLTSQQLAAALPDVAPATLYRHINRLAGGGILALVEQRPVRGAVEKVYTLAEQGALLGPEEIQSTSREEHLRHFAAFTATLLASFGRYLEQPEANPLRDGAGYRQVPLYLSDAELLEFTGRLGAVLLPALGNGPAPGRRRRVLSTILIPDPETPA